MPPAAAVTDDALYAAYFRGLVQGREEGRLEGIRLGLEAAGRHIQCGCPSSVREKIVTLPHNSGERWRLCGEANCGALDAAAIRALSPETITKEAGYG
jgi:hypothetical protein